MRSDPVVKLVSLTIEMSAEEAGELYAELYRLSRDVPYDYDADSKIGEMMRLLSSAEAPGT